MSIRLLRQLPAFALVAASLAALGLAYRSPTPQARYPSSQGAPTIDDFCSDPFKAVCQNQPTNADGRAKKINAHVDAALKRTLEAAVSWKSITADEASRIRTADQFNEFITKHPAPEIGIQLDAAYYYFYYTLVGSRINAAESAVEKHMEYAIGKVKEAVEHTLSGADAAAALENISQIQLVTHANASRLLAGEERLYQLYLNQFRLHCGARNVRDNAFTFVWLRNAGNAAVPVWKIASRYIVLCPGALLGAIEEAHGLSEDVQLNSVFQILAHEIGHQIDSGSLYENPYKTYFECLKSEQGYKSEFTDAKKREVTADFWALRALTLHVRDYEGGAELSFNKLRILRQSMGWLCGSSGAVAHPDPAAPHPTGQFRIEQLLRRDPWVHAEMACDQSYASTACGISGGISLPDMSAR